MSRFTAVNFVVRQLLLCCEAVGGVFGMQYQYQNDVNKVHHK